MENPGMGAGAPMVCKLGGCTPEHTAPRFNLQDTLDKATRHRWTAEMLGAVLALRYSQPDCLLLTTGAFFALPPEDRVRFIEAASLDIYSDDAAEREAERQRRQWAAWCAGRRVRA